MDLNIPKQLKYTSEHEWVLIENDVATVGITDFAQSSLGDIVFVELPEVGKQINRKETFGVVESIKSVSDLFAPLSGEVIEVNQTLEESPEMCNQGPYQAWIIKIKLSNENEISELLDAAKYKQHCENS